MTVFQRETVVEADLDTVWAFHGSVDGLAALTPDWFHLEFHGRELPEGVDGGPDPRSLQEGATVELSVRPFGVGPRQRWRSRIEVRRREDDRALMRDRMIDGPFDHWEHTHAFETTAGGTRVRDRVEYRLSDRTLCRGVDPLLVAGLDPTFRFRHRRLRSLLEGGEWDGWD